MGIGHKKEPQEVLLGSRSRWHGSHAENCEGEPRGVVAGWLLRDQRHEAKLLLTAWNADAVEKRHLSVVPHAQADNRRHGRIAFTADPVCFADTNVPDAAGSAPTAMIVRLIPGTARVDVVGDVLLKNAGSIMMQMHRACDRSFGQTN
jgi:hypothetical protein